MDKIERLNQRLESNKALVIEYNTEIDQIILELEKLEASNKEMSLVLSDKEDVLNLLKDSLGATTPFNERQRRRGQGNFF